MKSPKNNARFEALLDFLRQTRGFDFTGYKRPSLMRRINRRMEMANVKSYDDYTDYLEVHPEEFSQLFNNVLINLTSFFRDPAAWSYLGSEIIPRIVEATKTQDSIRVWSAGCSSGEEAYTLAIVLAEGFGMEAFRQRVKIYGTDADEEALVTARQAAYGAKELEPVPEDLKRKYFEPAKSRYVFHSELRRSVNFGRHDLMQDAPISRLDLLVCRNTLMYFNAEAQANIVHRFHFALNPNGFLFLGKAELLLTHAKLFSPMDMRQRVFSKVEDVNIRDRLLPTQPANHESVNDVRRQIGLRDAAFEASPTEELQSTNEELHAVNEEMRQRTGELNSVNTFLRSILSSMRGAMIVLNNDMGILIWNSKCEDFWGLRADEVQGKSLMNLDIGLPVQELRKPIRACLTGESDYQEVVVNATNRRGKAIQCRVACSRFVEDSKNHTGVMLLLEVLDD
jgi:two-component system CheB/CheR fusion protein